MAAAKPTMSPITPPPSAINVVLRSARFCISPSKMRLSVCQFLCASPSGRMMLKWDTPAASNAV
ncbi:hypothetical protein NM51_2038 [Neisseria meningitidis NM51]|nr:hypothetical protein NM51_2038 [Neisseria meningitidis NM51]